VVIFFVSRGKHTKIEKRGNDARLGHDGLFSKSSAGRLKMPSRGYDAWTNRYTMQASREAQLHLRLNS